METHLSLPELEAILDAARDQEEARQRFAASLKGIDLGEGRQSRDMFEEVEARAKAKLAGISQDAYDLSDLGVGVEDSDEGNDV